MKSLRALKFDLTLTDAECDDVIAAIDADVNAAGADLGEKTIRAIIDSHPRCDVANPPGYVAACAAIMAEYPSGVLQRLKDPRTGVVRKIKWLPKPAEIAEACEEEMRRRNSLRTCARAIKLCHSRGRDSQLPKPVAA